MRRSTVSVAFAALFVAAPAFAQGETAPAASAGAPAPSAAPTTSLAPPAALSASAEPAAHPAPATPEIAPLPAAEHAAPEAHPAAHAADGHAVEGHGAAPDHGAGHAAGAHGAQHHDAAEAHEDGPPGAINFADFGNKHQPPLLALFINFAVLLFVYVKFGKKPIADGLKERRDTIAKDIEHAAKLLSEAEERAETYQAKLSRKDSDAKEATASLVKAGEAERDRILEEAKEKAARLEKDAAFLRDQEVKQLRQDLVRETVERAIADAEALLKKGVTQADQERLAEEYLSTLGQPQPGGAS